MSVEYFVSYNFESKLFVVHELHDGILGRVVTPPIPLERAKNIALGLRSGNLDVNEECGYCGTHEDPNVICTDCYNNMK